jgi:hypothetical protein
MSLRNKLVFGTVAILVLAGLIGAACGGDLDAGGAGTTPIAGPEFVGDEAVTESGRAALGSGGDAFEGGLVLGEFQVPTVGPRIVKTAAVTLEVRAASFDQRFQEAALVASRHGGFVASSLTSDAKHQSATIVLRIPATQFDAALGELRRLGSVKREELSGQDVTAQFVDLESRLRNWEAQEDVLLRLMARAKTIEESIKVQRQLQEVQLAIESIKGQLRVLTDQTDLATITLAMREAGAVAAKPKTTLGKAWQEALGAFLSVIAAVVVGLGYMVPLALLGLFVFVAWVIYRRTRTRPAPSV